MNPMEQNPMERVRAAMGDILTGLVALAACLWLFIQQVHIPHRPGLPPPPAPVPLSPLVDVLASGGLVLAVYLIYDAARRIIKTPIK